MAFSGEFDFELDFDLGDPTPSPEPQERPKAKAKKTIDRHLYRRFAGEKQLEALVDWEFRPGECYHIISQGDIDSMTYLKFILRQQPLEYCLMSTWCMGMADVIDIGEYIELGRINRMDCYCGEIFRQRHAGDDEVSKQHKKLTEIMVGERWKVVYIPEPCKNFRWRGGKIRFCHRIQRKRKHEPAV